MLPRFFFPKPSAIEREAGWTGMISSITTLILGLAITAILGLMDWYAWRTAPVLPYPLESTGTWLPRSGRRGELQESYIAALGDGVIDI